MGPHELLIISITALLASLTRLVGQATIFAKFIHPNAVIMAKKITVLTILDGWGYREDNAHNAINAATTPTWDQLWKTRPHTLIGGSGNAVGLPDGQMGNSEVGHLNIGAGRIVYQEYTRINHAIREGDFFNNPTFTQACTQLKESGGALHIMGLLSPGGVHSHSNHILAMIDCAKQHDCNTVYCHAFLDGRDTPPRSAKPALADLESCLKKNQYAPIQTITGRYYSMDRDQRWDRVQAAYDCLTTNTAKYRAESAEAALAAAYAREENDEFVTPTRIGNAIISDNDIVIFMNFRADRARELTRAFTESDFSGFERTKTPKLADFICLTQYAKDISAAVAYPPVALKNTLGEYLSTLNKTQLRIAETEKYAHVTFFFNGGIEAPFAGEERTLIPSPKVATYDLQPEMHAHELTDQLIKAIESGQYDLIVCNYANADMVGHTGNFDATVKAIETLDQCLSRLVTSLESVDGEMLVTADHGNAEMMFDPKTGQAHTAHTNEPVPLLYIGPRLATITTQNGALSDLAPTLLTLMKLTQPKEMTGQCLLQFDA